MTNRRVFASSTIVALMIVGSLAACGSDKKSSEAGVGTIPDGSSSTTSIVISSPFLPANRTSIMEDADAVAVLSTGGEITSNKQLAAVNIADNEVVTLLSDEAAAFATHEMQLIGRYKETLYVTISDDEYNESDPIEDRTYGLYAVPLRIPGTDGYSVTKILDLEGGSVFPSADGKYLAIANFDEGSQYINSIQIANLDNEKPFENMPKIEVDSIFEKHKGLRSGPEGVSYSTDFFWNTLTNDFYITFFVAAPAGSTKISEAVGLVQVGLNGEENSYKELPASIGSEFDVASSMIDKDGHVVVRASRLQQPPSSDADKYDFTVFNLNGQQIDQGTYTLTIGDNAHEVPESLYYFSNPTLFSSSKYLEIFCASASCVSQQVLVRDFKLGQARSSDENAADLTSLDDYLINDIIL